MNKEIVENAFDQYDLGLRPENYRFPKSWYVLKGNGEAYPAKAIWSLATGMKLREFNTKEARIGLADLDYSLINVREGGGSALFEEELEKSASRSSDSRRERLKRSSAKPTIVFRLVKGYKRNPDVVAEVLARANGVCEGCHCKAPFNKKTNGKPYLEVHHNVQLAHGGDDSIDNAIALCPNCHGERHYG